jgi:hypothetical protein
LLSELGLTFVQCRNRFQRCGLRNSGSLEAVIQGDAHVNHDLFHQGLDVAGFHRHVRFHVLHSRPASSGATTAEPARPT